MNKSIIPSALVLFALLLIGCKDKPNNTSTEQTQEAETTDTVATQDESDSSETTHFLDYNGIKVVLPADFEKYSLVRYQEVLKGQLSEEEFAAENYRLQQLQKMDGELYLFFNEKQQSYISINAAPHVPFEKNDAQELLNGIALDNQNLPNLEKLKIENLEAKFSGNKNQQVFKAVYQFTEKKTKNNWFTTNYIVSANQKTLFMEITQSELVNYNPYIEKIVF